MSANLAPMNFLFATWEGGGSVMPVLTVARKLADHGHRVRVMSDSCNRPEAEAAGATFIPWTRAPNRADRSRDSDIFRDWEVATPVEQLGRVLDRIMAGPALAYAQDLIEQLQSEPADLVVANEMLLGVPLGCEAIGQKMALLTCNVSLFPVEGIPPLGPGLTPAMSAHDIALHAEITATNHQMFDSRLPALNAARAHYGLPAINRLADQHLVAERILLGTSRAFDFAPQQLPDHFVYVGPQLADPTWAAPWRNPWDAGDVRPLVLVGFSTTFQDHVAVLQNIIDGAADLDLRLLVTLGDTIASAELDPAPNCRLVHSAPHNQVMKEAAMVITHGGHGTVARALAHLRPMIIVPHGRDQNDNAVRVTHRGAGIQLPTDADPAAFRNAISAILSEPSYGEAANRLGMAVADDARQSPVARILEDIACAPSARTGLRAA